MKRRFLAALPLPVLAAACAVTEPGPSRPVAAEGRAFAEATCSRCHAVASEASSPHPEAPRFRDLVRQYPPSALAEAFAEGIEVGHPDMPRFMLQPHEIDMLIAYLEQLQG